MKITATWSGSAFGPSRNKLLARAAAVQSAARIHGRAGGFLEKNNRLSFALRCGLVSR
jgi:hypothetical protein